MQPLSPRLTLHCLNELGIELPTLRERVSSFEPQHGLLNKVKTLYQSQGEDHFERIKSVDDNRFLKCKIERFRGAMWIDSPSNDCIWWIVSAGFRTDGSKTDFYAELEFKCQNQLKEARRIDSSFKSGKSSNSDWLLPTEDDYILLQGAKVYYQLMVWNKDINDVYERSRKNQGLPITYNFTYNTNTVFIEFYTENDEETYITFGSNTYELLNKATATVITSLGLARDSFDMRSPTLPKVKTHKYMQQIYYLEPHH